MLKFDIHSLFCGCVNQYDCTVGIDFHQRCAEVFTSVLEFAIVVHRTLLEIDRDCALDFVPFKWTSRTGQPSQNLFRFVSLARLNQWPEDPIQYSCISTTQDELEGSSIRCTFTNACCRPTGNIPGFNSSSTFCLVACS